MTKESNERGAEIKHASLIKEDHRNLMISIKVELHKNKREEETKKKAYLFPNVC
jgi:hypothetical protein